MKIFRRFVSVVSALLMTFSVVSSNAFAGEIYTFTDEEINSSPVKPVITVGSKLLTADEIKQSNKVQVSINVAGANTKYSSTGLHICYDSRLKIAKDTFGYPDVRTGSATQRLTTMIPTLDPNSENPDMNGIFLTTSSSSNYGLDGTMWTINFILPDDVQEGDVFPIDIVYKENSKTADMFSDVANSKSGQLMSAYVFARGIYNKDTNYNFTADSADIAECPPLADIDKSYDGYIAVKGGSGTAGGDIVYGDANGDGNVNMSDATAIVQHIGNRDLYGLDSNGLKNADTNGDGQVTTEDSLIIQRMLAGEFELSDLPLKS